VDVFKKNIYCISGLGADEKVFDQLDIPGYTLKHIKWIRPLGNESLESYSKRLSEQIQEGFPILLGLSFGGMIAIEIAKQVAVKKIILISAVKTKREIPTWMRIVGRLKLNKIIPPKTNSFTEKSDDRRMGIRTIEEKTLVDSYRRSADQVQVDWAVDKILNWKNEWTPSNCFHIHGECDRMFPIKNIKATHVVAQGTHIMILNKPNEVSACVRDVLEK